MGLFTMHQQNGGTDLTAVFQDRHIHKGQRGRHIPTAIGVERAGMIAPRSFIIGVVVLHNTWSWQQRP